MDLESHPQRVTIDQRMFDKRLVISQVLSPGFEDFRVCLALYGDVKNAEDVTKYVKGPAADDALLHVFLNPHMVSRFTNQIFIILSMQIRLVNIMKILSMQICSIRHVQTAVLRALQNNRSNQMRSKSPFTEILFSLSPSAHVKLLNLIISKIVESDILEVSLYSIDFGVFEEVRYTSIVN